MNRSVIWAAPLAVALLVLAAPAAADETAERAARWHEVAAAIFGDRSMDDGAALMSLTIPDQTMDAALVPVTVELTGARPVAAVSVVVDNNPSPLAGSFHLGPAFVQSQPLKMRVRVNEFTLVHAVAETPDGKLHVVSKYVKAAGGCSAPSAMASDEVLARMGKMLLRRERGIDPGVVEARLLISHPNYNGMQRNAAGKYTPARYLEHVSVSVGGAKAFDLDTGISMSEDPSIGFTYGAKRGGSVDVTAKDSSHAVFAQRFPALD